MIDVEKIMKKRKEITDKYTFLQPELTLIETTQQKQMSKPTLCQICSKYFDKNSKLETSPSDTMCLSCISKMSQSSLRLGTGIIEC